MGSTVPEAVHLAMVKQYMCINIDITNNDPNDYTAAPVFADIPQEQIQALGCPFSQMRLEDSNGNPVTFWPDGNGANPVYPGYYSIWFKVDLPASGTVSLKLYCDPDNPTYTANATDVVDTYYDFSQIPPGSDTDGDVRIDSSVYLDPPSSLYLPNTNNVDTSHYNILRIPITVYERFIAKVNIMLSDQVSGGLLTGWTGSALAFPYVWLGNTSSGNCGSNIGYYDDTYHVLTQAPIDGNWHRYLILNRIDEKNYDLYLDGRLIGTDLPYGTSLEILTPGQQQYLEDYETVNTCDPNRHEDSFVYVGVPYEKLPTVSVALIMYTNDRCFRRDIDTT